MGSINHPSAIFLCPAEFALVQTKIVDVFKIQQRSTLAELKNRKRKPAGALVVSKKKRRRLLPFIQPEPGPGAAARQMASLATALTAMGAASATS